MSDDKIPESAMQAARYCWEMQLSPNQSDAENVRAIAWLVMEQVEAERKRVFEKTREAAVTRINQHLLGPAAGGNFEPHRYCCDMSYAIRTLTLADIEVRPWP